KLESIKIHVLLSSCNGGYGYGNNIGIRYSLNNLNADYTLIANPDVVFSEKTVCELTKVLIENENVVVSAPIPVKPNGEKQKRPAWKLPKRYQEVLSASILINRFFGVGFEYSDAYFAGEDI